MVDFAASGQVFLGQACLPSSFAYPEVFGAQFTSLEANLVTNYSLNIPQGLYYSHSARDVSGLQFCNVSLQYTHPGYNDSINTQVWLPVDEWNGRLQGSGGGGLQTGLFEFGMAGATGDGYATVSTDGGHVRDPYDVSSWALTSPGNVNWFLLQDFASVALNDAAVIGKSITKDFYGRAAAKSYFNGCSMGGRQGLHLAQRYPAAYDGILAAAPAINLDVFVPAEFWTQMVMHEAGKYPAPCEFAAITSAAIEACDELDGVKDGIVSAPELCQFDAKTLIGKKIDCADLKGEVSISELAVKVAETGWEGARKPDGTFLWYGLFHEAPLIGPIGLANTVCKDDSCGPDPFPIPASWMKWFVKKDADFDLKTLKHEDVTRMLHQSHQEYESIIGANDPDLTDFQRAGGKMITWHGLGDQVIMPNGSRSYYEAVTAFDPHVHDYYRYFEAPGTWHCYGGPGPYPGSAFETLIDWVERGKAPDTLLGRSTPDESGVVLERGICAFPKTARYNGQGDISKADSFTCV